MKRRNHLVILVKAPELGRVKTRLAQDIGASDALGFYRRTLAQLIQRVGRDPRWRTLLAVAPDRAAHPSKMWPARLPMMKQGLGDLGARMDRVFKKLPPGPAIIIGADIPGITRAEIASAFAKLAGVDAIVGPARDGGYWLIGLRRGPRLPYLFRNVRWSSPTALSDTWKNLHLRPVALAATLDDVDNGEGYARWRGQSLPPV
jgi:rSAM/selenodomain-associated transferase 1